MSTCSLGQQRLIPGPKPPYNAEHLQSARGVIDIDMPKTSHWDHEDDLALLQAAYLKAARRWLSHFLGDRGQVCDYVDHAIFIAPCKEFQ